MLTYLWSLCYPIAEFLHAKGGNFFIRTYELDLVNPFYGLTSKFLDYYSVFVIISASSIFLIFKDPKIKYSKTINYLSSLTFGIYLNHIFIRYQIYRFTPSIEGVFGLKYIFASILIFISTFVFSALLDMLRKTSALKIKLILKKD